MSINPTSTQLYDNNNKITVSQVSPSSWLETTPLILTQLGACRPHFRPIRAPSSPWRRRPPRPPASENGVQRQRPPRRRRRRRYVRPPQAQRRQSAAPGGPFPVVRETYPCGPNRGRAAAPAAAILSSSTRNLGQHSGYNGDVSRGNL